MLEPPLGVVQPFLAHALSQLAPTSPRASGTMSGPSSDADEFADHSALVPELREAILASETCPKDADGTRRVPLDEPAFLVRFLACAKGDVTKSVARHNAYWDARREFFGANDRPFDEAKCLEIRERMPFYLAPEGALDADGRQLIFVRPTLLDWTTLETDDALEYVWYTYDRALAKNTRGFVIVGDMRGLNPSRLNRAFMRKMARSLFGSMPVRIHAARICRQPFVFGVVWAFVRMLLPSKMAGRVKILGETYEEELFALLPRKSVPESLGGTLKVD